MSAAIWTFAASVVTALGLLLMYLGSKRHNENVEDTNVPLRDAIAAYFRKHSPVDARVEGRIATVKP